MLVYDHEPDPALIAEFNFDYAAWRETLTDKQRDLLDAFLREETTNEIARNFNLSPGRVSQIRRQLVESFHAFVGNTEPSVA